MTSADRRAPRIVPQGSRITYVHAPDWFGLDILIDADMVWPRSFQMAEVRGPADLALLTLSPDGMGPAGLVVDLRGGKVRGTTMVEVVRALRRGQLVIVADEPPPPEWPVIGSRVLGPADLALRPSEIADLFRNAGHEPTEGTVDAIHRESAGWPALVEAAAAGLRRDDPYADPASALAVMRTVAADTVLPALPRRWMPVCRRVAVLEGLAIEEVDDLDHTAAGVVREMLVANLLVSTSSLDGRVLSLVPSVQAAVLGDIGADSAELTRLRRAGALSRHRLGVLDAGLAAAHAAGDLELCAEILDTWTLKFAFTEHRARAQQVTLALPAEYLADRPAAALRAEFLGIIPVGSAPVRIPSTSAARRAACRSGAARRTVEQAFLALVGRRCHGRFDEATKIARATTPLVELGLRAVHSSMPGVAALWYLHAGLSYQLTGDLVTARQHFQKGWQERTRDEIGFVTRDLASKLALVEALDGRTPASQRWLTTLGSLPVENRNADHWIDYTVGVARLVQAVDGLRTHEVETWAHEFGDGAERDELWIHVVHARAQWELSQAQPGAARQLVADAMGRQLISISDGMHQPMLRAVSADAWLAEGKPHPASQLLGEIPETSSFRRVPAVRLLLMTDRPGEALQHVDRFMALADTPLRDRVELLLLRAAAADALDDETAALAALTVVVRTVRNDGLRRALTTAQPELLDKYADRLPGLAATLASLRGEGWHPIHPRRADMVKLSVRERAVLQELASGGTNTQIASALHVSANTVKTQLRALYAKLGVSAREDALAQARALGLLH